LGRLSATTVYPVHATPGDLPRNSGSCAAGRTRPRYGVARNVYGWGSGVSGILDTNAYCLHGFRGQWIVGATVSTERATQTVFSQYPAIDPASGAC
jgi:hypothetical protein